MFTLAKRMIWKKGVARILSTTVILASLTTGIGPGPYPVYAQDSEGDVVVQITQAEALVRNRDFWAHPQRDFYVQGAIDGTPFNLPRQNTIWDRDSAGWSPAVRLANALCGLILPLSRFRLRYPIRESQRSVTR